MKKRVRVTYEKEMEIEIDDDLLTEEALKEFSEGMHHVNSADDIFKYAAAQCFDGQCIFVEGLGPVRSQRYPDTEIRATVSVEIIDEDIHCEVLGEMA